MTRTIIVITKRSNDWMACLKDNPNILACSQSREGAIGRLVLTYAFVWPERWAIAIEEGKPT